MKTSFLILLCKCVTLAGKLLHRTASVFPGKLAYDIDQNILMKVKYPKYVIGVTGSSGKGSTVELIDHILESNGYSVACNKAGSNAVYAMTTLILNNTKIFSKKSKKDIYLLEIDERHLGFTFRKPTLTHLVITNITRDQPARNTSPELTFEEIINATYPNMHLIINADDPIVNRASLNFKGKITTYGIAKTKSSYTDLKINSIDAAYCPKCHTKLKYNFYHYGHLGDYYCSKKDFSRGKVDYEATDVLLKEQTMKINNKTICINKDILYAAYATTACYALCKEIGIDEKVILHSLNEDKIKPHRGNIYDFENRKINMLESKNENALSYYQSLEYIVSQGGKKTVILGFDNVSRRYQYNDISWLYDVNFEKLVDNNIDKILCIGKFRYDVATRLLYAGVKKDKIILVDDLNKLLNITNANTSGNIYTMVCFDMTSAILNMLKEYKHES